MLCMYTQVKLLVAADMGDVKETLNTSAFDTYDPSTKLWSQAIPCPIPPPHTQTQIRSKFTIASCQFAMHYMFQDIQRANHFFQQVSSNLQLGGVLIATTVDARVVADLAVKVDSEAKSGSGEYHKDLSIYADRVEDDEDLNIKNKKKSNVAAKSDDVSHPPGPLMMNIHFDEQNWNKLLNNTTNTVNSSLNRTQHIKTEKAQTPTQLKRIPLVSVTSSLWWMTPPRAMLWMPPSGWFPLEPLFEIWQRNMDWRLICVKIFMILCMIK